MDTHQLARDGSLLIVTEKATNKIVTYVVTAGLAGSPQIQDSVGITPFGFAFGGGGELIVSEAFGGAAGASAATSYTVSSTGQLTPISESIPSAQGAACWVTVVGTHAFASNTASNNLSTYNVTANGGLALAAGISATTGSGPLDSAATTAGEFLYVHNADASLSVYAIGAGGDLTPMPSFAGLPQRAIGLVAR